MRHNRGSGSKGLIRRALSALAAFALMGGIGVAVAAPASAGGINCAAGYVCLFDLHNNTNDRERFFQFSNPDYTTWQWGSYVGGWHLIPGTSINNQMSAINNNFQIDDLRIYMGINYSGTSTQVANGYANLTATIYFNNSISSHQAY